MGFVCLPGEPWLRMCNLSCISPFIVWKGYRKEVTRSSLNHSHCGCTKWNLNAPGMIFWLLRDTARMINDSIRKRSKATFRLLFVCLFFPKPNCCNALHRHPTLPPINLVPVPLHVKNKRVWTYLCCELTLAHMAEIFILNYYYFSNNLIIFP